MRCCRQQPLQPRLGRNKKQKKRVHKITSDRWLLVRKNGKDNTPDSKVIMCKYGHIVIRL